MNKTNSKIIQIKILANYIKNLFNKSQIKIVMIKIY